MEQGIRPLVRRRDNILDFEVSKGLIIPNTKDRFEREREEMYCVLVHTHGFTVASLDSATDAFGLQARL